MLPRSICGVTVVPAPVAAPPRPGPAVRSGRAGVQFTLTRDWALIEAAGTARFLAERGERIVVETAPGADDATVDLWLTGPAVVFALAQQHRFALHASTVAVHGTTVALAGRSRAGKSTTAMALGQHGATVLTDDVTLVETPVGREPATVTPTGRSLRLWPETFDRLGLDPDAVTGRTRADKLVIGLDPAGPVPLDAVIGLQLGSGRSARLTRAPGLAGGADLVRHHTHRRNLIEQVWPAELHRWSIAVAHTAAVWVLERPAGQWSVAEVVARVREAAAAGRAGDGPPVTEHAG